MSQQFQFFHVLKTGACGKCKLLNPVIKSSKGRKFLSSLGYREHKLKNLGLSPKIMWPIKGKKVDLSPNPIRSTFFFGVNNNQQFIIHDMMTTSYPQHRDNFDDVPQLYWLLTYFPHSTCHKKISPENSHERKRYHFVLKSLSIDHHNIRVQNLWIEELTRRTNNGSYM